MVRTRIIKILSQFSYIDHFNMMDTKICCFVVCLVTGYLLSGAHSLIEFTNIKCETLDRNFTDFEYCLLKSVNRTYKYFSLKVKLFQVPITQVQVNFALYKRLNGLKPFLYNITFDACKFLKKPRSNPVMSYFYDFLKIYSNMNHSCPFDHDLVLDKMSAEFVNDRVTRLLPFPEGSYLWQTDWYAYGTKRAEVGLYLTLS